MATTNLIPLHKGKAQSTSKAIAQVIRYVKNPEKTDSGSLVTSYGCNPELADAEFMLMKKQYLLQTGRARGKDDVLGYHMRQSFAPGEITPEEANRLGKDLAMRFTKGNNAFIVATHTDKHHIHNHIVFSAVNLECDRKFRNFWGSSKALEKLNDIICIENGYSIIENPQSRQKYNRYNKWMDREGVQRTPSQRDELRIAIENALSQNPQSLDVLLNLLISDGWEVKRGKHIALRFHGQQRFKRLDSLGNGYTQSELEARIAGINTAQRIIPMKPAQAPSLPTPNVSLLINLQTAIQKGKGIGYQQWAKKFNLKEMAKTFSYLKAHGLDSREELDKRAATASDQSKKILTRIQQIDARQQEIKTIKAAIYQYSKTREVYRQYKESNWSPKFKAQHEQEITMHKSAKATFDSLGVKKIPKIRELEAEYQSLQDEKNDLYPQYRNARDEMRQLLIVQENVHRILDDPAASIIDQHQLNR